MACAVLILLGLALLIAELKPARASRLAADPAQAGAVNIDTAYTRRGPSRRHPAPPSPASTASGQPRVKVKRRKVTVAATAAAQGKSRRPEPTRPDPGRRPPAPDRIEAPPGALGGRCGSPQEPLMHADRTNRILLLLLALLLIAVTSPQYGAASIGAFGTATRHSP